MGSGAGGTDSETSGHSSDVATVSAVVTEGAEPTGSRSDAPHPTVARPSFREVYDAHFDYVWRSARRLGVPADGVDDAVQDVFVTVFRRLDAFEGRSRIETWLYGITLRVVRDHRRRARRKPLHPFGEIEPPDATGLSPEDAADRNEGARVLHALLDALPDDKREVLVMTELEQMTAPEIAQVLDLNVNTVYARLRSARQAFEELVRVHRAAPGHPAQDGTP